MKTTPVEQSNELASQVSKMHNNNELWFHKHTHGFTTACNFIAVACAGISAVANYGKQEYVMLAASLAVFIFCANNFLQHGIYYTIELPKTHSKKLFKIGDVYFAGASESEAHLYACINDLDDEIECISTNCNSF